MEAVREGGAGSDLAPEPRPVGDPVSSWNPGTQMPREAEQIQDPL